MNDTLDILLSQKFLPEHGGSIRWMHQVYRRWPGPVQVITHDYYAAPPHTPEFPGDPVRPPEGDHVTDANLKMDRRDIFINNWGLESPRRALRYWRMTRAVGERMRSHQGPVRVHCIHAVPEVVSLIPLKWRYGKRLKIICYAHGEEVTACCSSRQLKWLMHRAHRIVDLMIANSRNTVSLLSGHIEASKVNVIHPGVELSEFDGSDSAGLRWRSEQGLADKMVVCTLGRLDPRKNHAAVVEAVARLAGRYPNLVYVLAGEGRQMNALKEQVARLSINDRVRFIGAVSDRDRKGFYGAADVFAMPAIRDGTDVEGFGMVFLEAGACGKPCVAGRAGGQAEAVRDGETGLVADGTDLDAVTAAIDRLLANPELRTRMGTAGKRYAQEFDWPRVVQRTVEVVEKL